jgi:hypothetical protein
MNGVNQKNFGLFFTIRSDMQASQLLIKTVRSYKIVVDLENKILALVIAIRNFLEGLDDTYLNFFRAACRSRLGLSRSWPADTSCLLDAACNANGDRAAACALPLARR